MNDLKGFLILILCAIPTIVSTNIDCNGRAFHCVNSSHFMICVDLGGGVSTTIDDFVIPCPPTTICHEHNIFECELIKIGTNEPLIQDNAAAIQSDSSVTDLVNNNVTVEFVLPTEPSTTVMAEENVNDTTLHAASEDLFDPMLEIKETLGSNNVHNKDAPIILPVSKFNDSKIEITNSDNTNTSQIEENNTKDSIILEENIGSKNEQNIKALSVNKLNHTEKEYATSVSTKRSTKIADSANKNITIKENTSIKIEHNMDASIILPISKFNYSEIEITNSDNTNTSQIEVNNTTDSIILEENIGSKNEQNVKALLVNKLNHTEKEYVTSDSTKRSTKVADSANNDMTIKEITGIKIEHNMDASIILPMSKFNYSKIEDSSIKIEANSGIENKNNSKNDTIITDLPEQSKIVATDILVREPVELFSNATKITENARFSLNDTLKNNSSSNSATMIHQYIMKNVTKAEKSNNVVGNENIFSDKQVNVTHETKTIPVERSLFKDIYEANVVKIENRQPTDSIMKNGTAQVTENDTTINWQHLTEEQFQKVTEQPLLSLAADKNVIHNAKEASSTMKNIMTQEHIVESTTPMVTGKLNFIGLNKADSIYHDEADKIVDTTTAPSFLNPTQSNAQNEILTTGILDNDTNLLNKTEELQIQISMTVAPTDKTEQNVDPDIILKTENKPMDYNSSETLQRDITHSIFKSSLLEIVNPTNSLIKRNITQDRIPQNNVIIDQLGIKNGYETTKQSNVVMNWDTLKTTAATPHIHDLNESKIPTTQKNSRPTLFQPTSREDYTTELTTTKNTTLMTSDMTLDTTNVEVTTEPILKTKILTDLVAANVDNNIEKIYKINISNILNSTRTTNVNNDNKQDKVEPINKVSNITFIDSVLVNASEGKNENISNNSQPRIMEQFKSTNLQLQLNLKENNLVNPALLEEHLETATLRPNLENAFINYDENYDVVKIPVSSTSTATTTQILSVNEMINEVTTEIPSFSTQIPSKNEIIKDKLNGIVLSTESIPTKFVDFSNVKSVDVINIGKHVIIDNGKEPHNDLLSDNSKTPIDNINRISSNTPSSFNFLDINYTNPSQRKTAYVTTEKTNDYITIPESRDLRSVAPNILKVTKDKSNIVSGKKISSTVIYQEERLPLEKDELNAEILGHTTKLPEQSSQKEAENITGNGKQKMNSSTPTLNSTSENGNTNPPLTKNYNATTKKTKDLAVVSIESRELPSVAPDFLKITTDKPNIISDMKISSAVVYQKENLTSKKDEINKEILVHLPTLSKQLPQTEAVILKEHGKEKQEMYSPISAPISTLEYSNESPSLTNIDYVTTENTNNALSNKLAAEADQLKIVHELNTVNKKSTGPQNISLSNASNKNVMYVSNTTVSPLPSIPSSIIHGKITPQPVVTYKEEVFPSEIVQTKSLVHLYQTTLAPIVTLNMNIATIPPLDQQSTPNFVSLELLTETTTAAPDSMIETISLGTDKISDTHRLGDLILGEVMVNEQNSNYTNDFNIFQQNTTEKNTVLIDIPQIVRTTDENSVAINNMQNGLIKRENGSQALKEKVMYLRNNDSTEEILTSMSFKGKSNNEIKNTFQHNLEAFNSSRVKSLSTESISSKNFTTSSKTVIASKKNENIEINNIAKIPQRNENKALESGKILYNNSNLSELNHSTVSLETQVPLNESAHSEFRLNSTNELKVDRPISDKLNGSKINNNVSQALASVPFVCSNHTHGKYADNRDCRKFYTCIGTLEPVVGRCSNNTVFSEINKQCTRNLSHCVRNNQFRCLYDGRFPDIFIDNIYYICAKKRINGFVRYKFQCKKNYHLNKLSVKCEKDLEISSQINPKLGFPKVDDDDKLSNNKVKSKNSTSLSNFDCKNEGKFPHAKESRKYYQCTKIKEGEYSLSIKNCSSDEVFDKKKRKCVESDSS